MRALAAAPDGLSVPELVAALGLEKKSAASHVRGILLAGLAEGWASREVLRGPYAARPTRVSARNAPVVVYWSSEVALKAERERLLARLAEIDAQLARIA